MTTSTAAQQDVRLAIILTAAQESLRYETTISSSVTVLALKEHLYKTLAGRPHPSGQSLQHLGRSLENTEIIGQIFSIPKVDTHTLYITLQGQAWTERPPAGAQVTQTNASQAATPHPHQLMTPGDLRARLDPRHERSPLVYIHWLHYNALRALLGYPYYTMANPAGRSMDAHRQDAVNFYAWSNVKWPSAFDKERELVSTPREVGDGVEYADYDGSSKPILKLQPASKPPTPLQKLALEIMTYTFPILSVEISPAQLESVNPRNRHRKAKIDAYMQAVHHAWAHNLPVPPPPQLDDRPAAPPANRQIIIRVGVEALFLVVRASLVYWFLRPFTRVITGVAFVGWIFYEVYQLWARPAAPNLNGAGGQRPPAAAPVAGAGAGVAPAGAVVPAGAAGGGGQNANGQAPADAIAAVGANGAAVAGDVANGRPANGGAPAPPRNFWQRSAGLGLAHEAKASMGTQAPGQVQPNYVQLGWRHRVVMFFTMLVMTVHPRYWTERQQLLRDRERELRVMYGPLREDEEDNTNTAEEARVGADQKAEVRLIEGESSQANGSDRTIHAESSKTHSPPKPRPPPGYVGQYIDRARRGLL